MNLLLVLLVIVGLCIALVLGVLVGAFFLWLSAKILAVRDVDFHGAWILNWKYFGVQIALSLGFALLGVIGIVQVDQGDGSLISSGIFTVIFLAIAVSMLCNEFDCGFIHGFIVLLLANLLPIAAVIGVFFLMGGPAAVIEKAQKAIEQAQSGSSDRRDQNVILP
jgi:hypothetical protein